MTITAIHRHDTQQGNACKRVAFYYNEVDAPLDRIEAQRVTMPDGNTPVAGETMKCGSCGAEIGPEALDMLPGELNARAIN